MKTVVGCFVWGTKYPQAYVDRLELGLRRHTTFPFRFRVFHPAPEDMHLTEVKGCFARLRVFDPEWQARNGIDPGDRLVIVDLDVVVTGDLEPLLTKPEPFGILCGVNSANPGKFNGSFWWTTGGYRPDVWTDFSLEAAAKVPFYEFPDDQAWLEAKLADVAGEVGPGDGLYALHKPGWPRGDALPRNARLVAFPGWRDPAGYVTLDWVKRHWLPDPAAA